MADMRKSSLQVQPVGSISPVFRVKNRMLIDISEIADRFPDFRVAVVTATGLSVEAGRPAALDRLINDYETDCRRRWAGTVLSEIPGIAVWRRAYRSFGIKRTSYRSSVERLVKNVLAARNLPSINSFVDVYNAVSLRHVMPSGADDLDHVVGDLAFRYSRPGDSFLDMAGNAAGEGGAVGTLDPPKDGEVVYTDREKVLCRRWNWRQDARSLVMAATKRAVVTLQYNGVGDLDAAADDLIGLIARFAGGTTNVAVADRTRPTVEIET
jgi:DNA/RNA-binding domain of Phe-tRNA-synthetase-like protein